MLEEITYVTTFCGFFTLANSAYVWSSIPQDAKHLLFV